VPPHGTIERPEPCQESVSTISRGRMLRQIRTLDCVGKALCLKGSFAGTAQCPSSPESWSPVPLDVLRRLAIHLSKRLGQIHGIHFAGEEGQIEDRLIDSFLRETLAFGQIGLKRPHPARFQCVFYPALASAHRAVDLSRGLLVSVQAQYRDGRVACGESAGEGLAGRGR